MFILPASSVSDRPAFAGLRIAALALSLLVSGCGTFRSYDKELGQTINQVSYGNVDGAIKVLESNNKSATKDLLYYLELGELQRLKERYPESQKSWTSANKQVQAWEDTAKTNPNVLFADAASYLVNDKVRPYEGHDYEKVMLTTNMALNFLSMDEYENARVAIKQTHEREAVIAELRGKEVAAVERDAAKRGARTSFKELNGYPVQSIDNPAVNALKNSYQSALSHYLAGFVYEAQGEPSLAAPGYRLAIELQPNQPLLEEASARIGPTGERARRRTDGRVVRDRIGHRASAGVAPVPAAHPGQPHADPDPDLLSGDGGDIQGFPAGTAPAG